VTYPVKVTLVEDEPIAEKLRFKLFQNYPNPFNSETKIKFSIPESVSHPVELKIYDVLGRETTRIFKGELKPGIYEVNFDSSGLSSGVYFCVLLAGKFHDVIKMVVLK